MLQSCFNKAAKLPKGELGASTSKSIFLACPPPPPTHTHSRVQYVGLGHAVAQAEIQVQYQGRKCGFLIDKLALRHITMPIEGNTRFSADGIFQTIG
jgi:hypothetical protein